MSHAAIARAHFILISIYLDSIPIIEDRVSVVIIERELLRSPLLRKSSDNRNEYFRGVKRLKEIRAFAL